MLVIVLLVAAALLLGGSHGDPAPTASAASRSAVEAHFEVGNFSEFSEPNVSDGQLAITDKTAYDGRRSARASYCGGGGNGYARGVMRPDWHNGDDVWYGMALYLPPGFKDDMAGEVALMRWDNFGLYGSGGDVGGIVIFGADKRARLVRGQYESGSVDQLGRAFDLPEGRWVWLEVHQRFGRDDGALNAVYLDGRRVLSTHRANTFGRPIDRLRFGLVAVASPTQRTYLQLWFDRVTIGSSQAGPEAARERATVPAAQRRSTSRRPSIGSCR
jgi:hypothetical protein